MPRALEEFHSPRRHGFVKESTIRLHISVASPIPRLADPIAGLVWFPNHLSLLGRLFEESLFSLNVSGCKGTRCSWTFKPDI